MQRWWWQGSLGLLLKEFHMQSISEIQPSSVRGCRKRQNQMLQIVSKVYHQATKSLTVKEKYLKYDLLK